MSSLSTTEIKDFFIGSQPQDRDYEIDFDPSKLHIIQKICICLQVKGVKKSPPPVGSDMIFKILNRSESFSLDSIFSALAPNIYICSIRGHDLVFPGKSLIVWSISSLSEGHYPLNTLRAYPKSPAALNVI